MCSTGAASPLRRDRPRARHDAVRGGADEARALARPSPPPKLLRQAMNDRPRRRPASCSPLRASCLLAALLPEPARLARHRRARPHRRHGAPARLRGRAEAPDRCPRPRRRSAHSCRVGKKFRRAMTRNRLAGGCDRPRDRRPKCVPSTCSRAKSRRPSVARPSAPLIAAFVTGASCSPTFSRRLLQGERERLAEAHRAARGARGARTRSGAAARPGDARTGSQAGQSVSPRCRPRSTDGSRGIACCARFRSSCRGRLALVEEPPSSAPGAADDERRRRSADRS